MTLLGKYHILSRVPRGKKKKKQKKTRGSRAKKKKVGFVRKKEVGLKKKPFLDRVEGVALEKKVLHERRAKTVWSLP